MEAHKRLPLPTSDLNEPLLPTYSRGFSETVDAQGNLVAGTKLCPAPTEGPKKEGFDALSIVGKVFWLVVALVAQSAWGLYGVCCRYLQVHAGVPPLYLTFLITALASVSLLGLVSLPTFIWTTCQTKICRVDREDDDDLPSEGKPLGMTRFKYAIGCGLAYFTLTVTNIGALQLTQAYYVQLVFISLPIFVAILNRILFKQRAPTGLWSSIMLVAVGIALIVYGGMRQSNADTQLSSKDAVGFGLSGIAVFSLAVFLILAQSSHGYLSHDQVLWAAFFTQLTVSLFFSKMAEHVSFDILKDFDTPNWACLLGAGVGVMFGANILQQLVIRAIGAPLMSMFMPMNLVAATLGSYYILGEKIENWFQGSGLIVVAVSITIFLVVQMRSRV